MITGMNVETKPLHAAQIPLTWGFYYWQPLAFITTPLLPRSFARSYLHRTRGNLDEEHEFASQQKKGHLAPNPHFPSTYLNIETDKKNPQPSFLNRIPSCCRDTKPIRQNNKADATGKPGKRADGASHRL